MKNYITSLFLAFLVLMTAGMLNAQAGPSTYTWATPTGTGPLGSSVSFANGPAPSNFSIAYAVTGTPGACTFKVEGSPDNSSWSTLVAPTSCTATGLVTISSTPVNYLRINMLTWTASGATVLFTQTNAAPSATSTGGSGTVNTGTTGQIAGYSANGTVVGAIPATTFDIVGNLTNTKSITSNIIAAPVVAPLAVYGFGDSIMACAHVTNLPNCFINHLAAEADGSGTGIAINRGFPGDLSADVAWRILLADNPAVGGGQNFYSVLVGTNDANTNGLGPTTWEANFKLFHTAVLSWLAIPATYKVAGSTATPTGTCANDTTFVFVTGEKCTANASTLTVSATTYGGTAYIWYRAISSDAGTWTYAIDGGTAVPVTTAPPINFSTLNGHTSTMAVIRVTGLTSASHSFVFTQTGAGTMSILGIGTVPNLAYTSIPTVQAFDIPKQLDGNIAATTSAYSADSLADTNMLIADGLNLHYGALQSVVQATTAAADMFDTVHPNDTGHLEMYRSARAALSLASTYPSPFGYNPTSNGTLTANVLAMNFEGTVSGQTYQMKVGHVGTGGGQLFITGDSTHMGFIRYEQPAASPKWYVGLYGGTGKGANYLAYDVSTSKYPLDLPQGMPQDSYTGNANGASFLTINTNANCSSSASPAVCAAAPAGSVVVAAAATTVVVNTTAVTANSQIDVKFDASLGTKLGVTCNTTFVNAWPTVRVAATSFTVTVASAPTTNPACFSYTVIN